MAASLIDHSHALRRIYPWLKAPFIVAAPMRVMTGAQLAVATTRAGGLGFIGPGAKAEDTFRELESAKQLLASQAESETASATKAQSRAGLLPVGVGFQTWNGDIDVAARAVEAHRPCAAWLFAPRHGQGELDDWARRIREACRDTQIWVQVGTLREATDAARGSSPPDVLVIQGAEAGGHGRAVDGMGIVTLLPEVQDALRDSGIPLFAAGGIADGRGVAAALGLGAAGVVMGTRFLASTEARISKGYQDEVVRAQDGATSTLRTQLYNHLRGTFGWPEQFSPRTVVNQSWNDHVAGVSFEELKERHDRAAAEGDKGWGPEGRLATYAGANVGLIRSVEDAGTIITRTREEYSDIVRSLQNALQSRI